MVEVNDFEKEIKLPKEYEEIMNREYFKVDYYHTTVEESDVYSATKIEAFTGKDYIATCRDEWNDFFSENETFSDYMDSLGIPLEKIEFDKIYAGNIVSGEVAKMDSPKDLQEMISDYLMEGYKEGNGDKFRNSEEHFYNMAANIEKDKNNRLEKEIIKIDTGYYIGNVFLREREIFKNSEHYSNDKKITVYQTANLNEPKIKNITISEYTDYRKEEELNKTPFLKENIANNSKIGTGFYYNDLLTYYNKKNFSDTKLEAGESFNEDDSTLILDTGTYSYEYDPAVGNIDKIDTRKNFISTSFVADNSEKSKRDIEKDLISEIEKEPDREKQRQDTLKRQRLEMLKRKNIER